MLRKIFAIGVAAGVAMLIAGAAHADSTEFSSQGWQKKQGVPQGVRRGPGGPGPGVNPAFRRGPGGPGVNPAFRRGPGGPGVNPAFRAGPGFRGPMVAPQGIVRAGPPGFRRPLGFVPFRGMRANFIRGPHRVFRGGRYLPLVGLAALGGIYVAGRYYVPHAYVEGIAGPTCSGPTEDGMCELRLMEVPLETGGAELQCVAFCPQ